MDNYDWKWTGSVWEFLGSVSWCMVIQEARRRGELTSRLMTDSDRNMEKAIEYGISDHALAKEMVRVGLTILALSGEEAPEGER